MMLRCLWDISVMRSVGISNTTCHEKNNSAKKGRVHNCHLVTYLQSLLCSVDDPDNSKPVTQRCRDATGHLEVIWGSKMLIPHIDYIKSWQVYKIMSTTATRYSNCLLHGSSLPPPLKGPDGRGMP